MTYNKVSVEDIEVKGKKVLVRCDFNVPLDADGNITDENRIVGALPTIKYLMENGATTYGRKFILCLRKAQPVMEAPFLYLRLLGLSTFVILESPTSDA